MNFVYLIKPAKYTTSTHTHTHTHTHKHTQYTYIYIYISKLANCSPG